MRLFLIAAAVTLALVQGIDYGGCGCKRCKIMLDGGQGKCNKADGQTPEENCRIFCEVENGACASSCEMSEEDHNNKDVCLCHYGHQQGVCWADPRHVTLDGNYFYPRINYHGTCRHTLMKPCKPTKSFPAFRVSALNVGSPLTVPGSVFLTVFDWGIEVELRKRVAKVNGKVVSLPFKDTFGGKYPGTITIHEDDNPRSSYHALRAATSFGVWITEHSLRGKWPYITTANIVKHPEFIGNMCGLYGNMDKNATNDLIDANGKFWALRGWHSNYPELGDSWCEDPNDRMSKAKIDKKLKEAKATVAACLRDTGRKRYAEELCGPIKSLTACGSVDQAYEDCLTDVCMSKGRKEQQGMACTHRQLLAENCKRDDIAC